MRRLSERVAAALLHLTRGGDGAVRVGAHEILGQRCLYDHDAERVREHVVQFTRDPLPLGRRRELHDVPRPLRLRRQFPAALERTAKHVAERPWSNGEDEPEDQVRAEVREQLERQHHDDERGTEAREAGRDPRRMKTDCERGKRNRKDPGRRRVELNPEQRRQDLRGRHRKRHRERIPTPKDEGDAGKPVRPDRRPQRSVTLNDHLGCADRTECDRQHSVLAARVEPAHTTHANPATARQHQPWG
jgi:hypothetical protein